MASRTEGGIPALQSTPRLKPRIFFWLLRRSMVAAFHDGIFGIAKGVAYSALLSFFPLLTSAAAILVQSHAGFVSEMMERALSEIVPPGSEELVFQQFRISGARPVSLLIVAGIISVWAASGVVKSLIEGFQAAYRIPRNRGFFHQSGVAILLVLGSAAPWLCASLLVVFGGQVESAVFRWMQLDPVLHPLSGALQWISRVARYGVAFATMVLVTASLYYFGPYRPQRWRFVWPGAILATVLWLIATSVFGWYARNIAHYNLLYGSVGAIIALLVWMYVLALVALLGCEFNAEYERNANERN
jgi:membrane protein